MDNNCGPLSYEEELEFKRRLEEDRLRSYEPIDNINKIPSCKKCKSYLSDITKNDGICDRCQKKEAKKLLKENEMAMLVRKILKMAYEDALNAEKNCGNSYDKNTELLKLIYNIKQRNKIID